MNLSWIQWVDTMDIIPRSKVDKAIDHDVVKLVRIFQHMFNSPSLDTELANIPPDDAFQIFNLIDFVSPPSCICDCPHVRQILVSGLPPNDALENYNTNRFSHQAHRCLNTISNFLGQLPEEMSIVNVTLSSPHPVKTGGFASIYRGTYVNRKGKTIDIALKLLKIFETQSEDDRLRLSKAFCKEALVWQYLRHKNIVSLLGIDSTMFPARAMVSRWMRHGNVLDHMKEKPFSKIGPGGYAIQLVCGHNSWRRVLLMCIAPRCTCWLGISPFCGYHPW
jgi:hypothetical protein